MTEGGDVVPLFPGIDQEDEDRPLKTGERAHCSHRRTKLDREARRVYCRDCGREVDAFEVLVGLARDPERLIGARKAAEMRLRQVKAKLDELLRQERNAKSRKRRRER